MKFAKYENLQSQFSNKYLIINTDKEHIKSPIQTLRIIYVQTQWFNRKYISDRINPLTMTCLRIADILNRFRQRELLALARGFSHSLSVNNV